jgi:ankyrin repeat protein
MKTHSILFSFIIGIQISTVSISAMDRPSKKKVVDPATQTLFHQAALEGKSEKITSSIKAGADVNMPDSTGASPLACAFKSGNIKAISMLIGFGASVDAHDVNKEQILDLFKNYPLLCDILYNRRVLRNDTREHSDALLWTAFTIAVSQGRVEALQNLLHRYSLTNDGLVNFTKLVLRIRKTATLTTLQRAHYQAIKEILTDQVYERYPLFGRKPMD